MPAIDNVVSINITQQSVAVAQQAFNVPLILGSSSPGWNSGDYVHTYSAPAGMLTDGFTSSAPEYLWAQAMFSQSVVPSIFKVGRRTTTAAAQVDQFAVATLTTGHVYSLTVQGTLCTYTATGGDTQQSILTALNTQIQAAAPVTGTVSGTGAAARLNLTASTAGQVITYSGVDSFLTRSATTAAAGIASDLQNASVQDASWYGVVTPNAADSDILQGAAWVEANPKLYVAASSSAGVLTNSTSDVASQAKAAAYKRTAIMYSQAGITQGIDAAWLASQLAQTPGSNTWAYKTLAGITADALTQTQIFNAIGQPLNGIVGKNANIYTPIGGVNCTQMGTTASGQYIDLTVGTDWFKSDAQAGIFAAIANALKVPFTDAGVAMLMAPVRASIDRGISNGLIDGRSTNYVSAPAVATISNNQRAGRIAPTISFGFRFAGAIHNVQVQGNVSV